ncbi:MAG: PKD domain-containing protein [Thermoplasmata archaeon]
MPLVRASAAGRHGASVWPVGLFSAVVVVLMVVSGTGLFTGNVSSGALTGSPAGNASPVGPLRTLPGAHAPPIPFSGPSPQLSPSAHLAGATPQSWGGRSVPPGAPLPRPGAPGSSGAGGSRGGNGSGLNQFCYGVWPSEGNQSTYLAGCYGHDEPGINPYSSLPGSGGNVTWNVTLPTDRSPTENQSDLYTAIWFGMVLTDPYAWMDECFLELQFYPDSVWPGSTLSPNGNWVGAAVAWQIEASSGYENACFYQELGPDPLNGSYLNMQQGDRVQVRMVGWTGSPYGENLTIADLTNGQATRVNLYNHTLHYPLDPSYVANDVPNALHWTPGGQLSVSFAFENGHTVAPYPNNNSYGGCSSGVPPSRPTDPAVPCPSYDGGSWANDTFTPWEIPAPVFSNGTATATSTQFGFSQDLGGISLIDPLSNGTCTGRDGSAWCTYPWWSYSCSQDAFEFGATDYANGSIDFGKYDQYATQSVQDGVGNGYYPLTNVARPACGGPTVSLQILLPANSPGTVRFLDRTLAESGVTQTYTFAGLLPGDYSIFANVTNGTFRGVGWAASGGATFADPTSAWTHLTLTRNGAVTANLGYGALVTVDFNDTGGAGWQGIAPGTLFPAPGGVITVPTNGSTLLAPGVYSLLAYPRPGFNFSHWIVEGANASVAAPYLPFTWLNISGGVVAPIDVVAIFTPTTLSEWVYVYSSGSGTVTFNGSAYASGYSAVLLPIGTYAFALSASPGSTVAGAYVYGSALVLGQDLTRTNVTLEGGTTYLYGFFALAPNVTLVDAPANGTISLADAPPVANGTVVADPLYFGPSFQDLFAVAPPNTTFSHWTYSSPASAWVRSPTRAFTSVEVNASVTITATFLPSPGGTLRLFTSPGGVGSIRLDLGATSPNGTVLPWATNSTHFVQGVVPANFTCLGFRATNGATVTPIPRTSLSCAAEVAIASVGTNVTLDLAAFPASPVPVTFVSEPPGGHATIGGVPVPDGATLTLNGGNHSLSAVAPSGTVVDWTTTANLSVVPNGAGGWILEVHGPGSVYAFPPGQLQAQIGVTPSMGQLPLTVNCTARAAGGTLPYAFTWTFGDGSGATGDPVAHTFTTAGSFVVDFWLNDSAGGSFAVNTTVVVLPAPLAATIVALPSSGEAPLNVSLSASAIGGVPSYAYAWSYGDGFGGVGRSVDHVYASPGTYPVIVQVNDAAGTVARATTSVQVGVAPTVAIAVAGSTAHAPALLTLSASVTGGQGPFNYAWTLGDGASAQGSSVVTHRYATGATFNASVLVTDALGGQATGVTLIQVGAAVPLVVQFAISPSQVVAGSAVAFTTSATGGSGTDTYRWSGLPGGCPDPGNLSQFVCSPDQVGTFNVSVAVTDGVGTSTTVHATLRVTAVGTTSLLPPILGLPGYDGWGVVVAIVVVLLALVSLLGRRRRPASRPAPPAPWSGPVAPGTAEDGGMVGVRTPESRGPSP